VRGETARVQLCASTNLNCRFVLSSIPRSNQATVIPGGKGHPYAAVHALPGATLVIIFRERGILLGRNARRYPPILVSLFLPSSSSLPPLHASIRDTGAASSAGADLIANIRGRAANSPRAASECNFAAAATVSIYSARGPRMRAPCIPRRGNFPLRMRQRKVVRARARVIPSYFFGKSVCVVLVRDRTSTSAHLARITYERIELSQASEAPINYIN